MSRAERYSRQVLHWGAANQALIGKACLLIAGVGGLGATVSQLLVRAGIGKLYLIDDGVLDWPDLNRQTLYGEADVGRAKLPLAKKRLQKINSECAIELIPGRIGDDLVIPEAVVGVVDCLDNYASRFALERAVPDGRFFVHGGLSGDNGQVLSLQKGRSKPLEAIFAGSVQPPGKIPVTPDHVVVIAGMMVNEIFAHLFGQPKLLDRCLVLGLQDFHLAFLEI